MPSSLNIVPHFSLRKFNTFGIDVKAEYFASFDSLDELEALMAWARSQQKPVMILGGGSNVLFKSDFEGLVLKNNIQGIEELHEDAEAVYVKAGAGVVWHQFVLYAIGKGWGGVENLSLIPGNVGAAPMQNIGAYGVELESAFWNLEAFHITDQKVCTFTRSDCEFGYRESAFKRKWKGKYIILNVTFRLLKSPILHTSYGAIRDELQRMNVTVPDIRSVSQAVINIRQSKLPDPAVTGNAGSFYKNPSVSLEQFETLRQRFPEIIGYRNNDGTMKLAAGWLIEQCGWKGYREGDAGCHDKQALVLVNFGSASGQQIFDLSEKILKSVKETFNVELEREVNIV